MVSEDFLKGAPKDSQSEKPLLFIYKKMFLDYWIKGIRNQKLQQVVLSNNFNNLEQAVNYAKCMETVFHTYSNDKSNENLNGKNNKVFPHNYSKNGGQNSFPKQSKNFKQEKTDNPGPSKPKLKCSFCGIPNHTEDKCRKKQAMKKEINSMQSKNDQHQEEIPPDVLLAQLAKRMNFV